MTPRQRPFVLGNWKMHFTAREAVAHVRALVARVAARPDREIAVAPPYTALYAVAPLLEGSAIALAAQDLSWEDEGPYTGEISGVMLQDCGVTYVLVAHSERRRHLDETDRVAGLKMKAALRSGLKPVLCVGEDEADRDSGRAALVVRAQLARGLEWVAAAEAGRIQVAYEPVWAIGTGKAASAAQASEMHAVLRGELRARFKERADDIRVLYGGSVTTKNVDELMTTPGVDGVLVGGASLKVEEFARIAAFGAARTS